MPTLDRTTDSHPDRHGIVDGSTHGDNFRRTPVRYARPPSACHALPRIERKAGPVGRRPATPGWFSTTDDSTGDRSVGQPVAQGVADVEVVTHCTPHHLGILARRQRL